MAMLMQEDLETATVESSSLKPGWTMLSEDWNGVFWHESTKSLLIVYVDDFKLAAGAELDDEPWAAIKSVIHMDDETYDGRFLGCA